MVRSLEVITEEFRDYCSIHRSDLEITNARGSLGEKEWSAYDGILTGLVYIKEFLDSVAKNKKSLPDYTDYLFHDILESTNTFIRQFEEYNEPESPERNHRYRKISHPTTGTRWLAWYHDKFIREGWYYRCNLNGEPKTHLDISDIEYDCSIKFVDILQMRKPLGYYIEMLQQNRPDEMPHYTERLVKHMVRKSLLVYNYIFEMGNSA
jgi:hypothetical protein